MEVMTLTRSIDLVFFMAQHFHMDASAQKYAQMTDRHSYSGTT